MPFTREHSTGDPSTLLLFPTDVERERFEGVVGDGDADVRTETCGFGPVAAAARTAQLLGRHRPLRVILIGIAGTYDEDRLPVGAASTFDSVVLDGVGAGQGEMYRGATELGFPQWLGSRDTVDEPVHEQLDLASVGRAPSQARVLVTVCAASATQPEAARRRAAHPTALAEDMEGFAVALACRFHGVPVSVYRGISNVAGDRDQSRWTVGPALVAARRLLLEALENRPVTERPT